MGHRDRSMANWVPVALAPVAMAYAVAAVAVATRHGELTTYAGRSPGAAVVEVTAGLLLLGAGLTTWRLRPARPWGALALVAGVAWFAPDWIGWQLGPGAVRMLGIAGQSVVAAALAHLALSAVGRRPPALVGGLWVATGVVAIGRAAAYDPFADPACFADCAANPLLAVSDRGVARAMDWADTGVALAAVAVVLGATVAVARRPTAVRLGLAPILAPALVLAAAWALRTTALAIRPGDDPRRGVLVGAFAVRAAAMAALTAGLLWALSRARRGVWALRRLAQAADPLQDILVRATQDASLRVAFPLAGDGGWIDGDGTPVPAPSGTPHRAVSLITREDKPIAAVLHEPTSLDAATLEHELGAAAQLAVDNERLRAEARAQLRELRGSRVRIVEAGDAERRRLERDLHDGAQQRLVGLSLVLGMARERGASAALAVADADLRRAIDELRDLAHGIHPVELSDEGLAAALETLADRATVPVQLDALPDERAPSSVESAGYVLVDEVLRLASERGDGAAIGIAARRHEALLVVEVHDERGGPADALLAQLVGVADRVSALDGRLTAWAGDGGGVHVRAELPCA